jgi:uncharacterized protein (TIGR02118 family)
MIRVSVFYPNSPGKKFDLDYYVNRHMPMVVDLLKPGGLVKAEVDKGLGTAQPGAPAPYVCVGHVYFQSVEAFQQAFGPHADRLMGDIPNYTDIEPILQISDIVLG